MRKLLVLQSTWAMERRHTDGVERSMEESFALIRDAGFDGISDFYADEAHVARAARWREGLGWSVEALAFPKTVDDLKPALELAAKYPVHHLNLQPDVRLRKIDDCLPLIDGWLRLAEEADFPVVIETHRDRMTTDLFFTLDLLDRYPELPLNADLSHYLVGR